MIKMDYNSQFLGNAYAHPSGAQNDGEMNVKSDDEIFAEWWKI